MKQYLYKALAPDGHIVTGTVAAASLSGARGLLKREGLRVISVRKEAPWGRRRLSRRKMSLLAREWSALLEAGLPMTESLRLLAPHRGKREQAVLSEVSRTLETGQPLREALSESGAFPPFFLALTAVGEMSGTLPRELLRLSEYYQKEADLRRRLMGAAAYPLFICLFIIGLFFAILTVILPSFALLFDTLSVPMPPVTASMLALGLWLRLHGITMLAMLLALAAMLTLYVRSRQGRARWDTLSFRSHFVRRLFLIRLCHTLSALMESSCPLSEALEKAAVLSGNLCGERRIRRVHAELVQGGHFPCPRPRRPHHARPLFPDRSRHGDGPAPRIHEKRRPAHDGRNGTKTRRL